MKTCLIILIIIVLTGPVSEAERVRKDWSGYPITWHVCQDCSQPGTFRTISEAVEAARPGDTINIWGEISCTGYGQIYEYNEELIIDKPLTLTCYNPEPMLGLPILTHDGRSGTSGAVITILPGGEGTVIKNLHIRGPKTGLVTDCDSVNPVDCMQNHAGIRIRADNCRIVDCTITRCMTGIYITGMGNTVQDCRIGERWKGFLDGDWYAVEEWRPDIMGRSIDHTGNGFGIVVIEPRRSTEDSLRIPNNIQDNVFRGNRYTEIVEIK